MRAWEHACFSDGEISERVVMESAGRAVAAAIAQTYPEGRVVGAVGGGNNGGDAIVALRTLAAMGREVAAIFLPGADARRDLLHGWDLQRLDGPAESAFASASVLVDGLLGTGATGEPREPHASMIRAGNASDRPIVAIDGPSGIDLTTGAAPGEAIRAAVTVTFGAVKRGLLLYPGREYAGRILLAEVGFPPAPPPPPAGILMDRWVHARIPRIPPDAHKSSVGLVAVVSGCDEIGGAIVMTAMGALRAGAGGVRVFSTESNRTVVNTAVPEAVFFDRNGDDVDTALAGTRSAVIGPGMGTDAEARAFLHRLLERYTGKLVLDADALTLLAAEPDALTPEVAHRAVMTPHPGELARLLGTTTEQILADRFATAAAAAERYGCVVLAKGAPTLVAAPDEPVLVALSGHSGVATGGMGDTLSGVIGAFLAAGSTPHEAATAGIHVAGRAAETAGRSRGLLPRDVSDALPAVLLREAEPRAAEWPFLLDLPLPG